VRWNWRAIPLSNQRTPHSDFKDPLHNPGSASNGLHEPEEYRSSPLQLPRRITHLRYWGDYWQDDRSLLVSATGAADLYRTVTTPQKITLQAGWNQLFLRAYALGYDLHFGAVLKADAGQLGRLRLSVTPPETQPPGQ
jgi:hypothetical protein